MHTSIWIKLGISLGLAFVGLFAINMIGDWMGERGGDHGEATHVADADHTDAAPADAAPADADHEDGATEDVVTDASHADTAHEDVASADDTPMEEELADESATPAEEDEAPTEEPAVDVAVVAMAGDAEAGAKSAKRKCGTCHTFGAGEANKVGPNLFGVVVRGRAAMEGYKYSAGLKAMGGSWSDADLDAYLTDPKGFAKGSKMSLKVRKEEDRADFIAYLKTLQ